MMAINKIQLLISLVIFLESFTLVSVEAETSKIDDRSGMTNHLNLTVKEKKLRVGNSLSPFIDVWYGNAQRFGHIGQPQNWVNVLGNVYDPDGVASLTYSLNGGPQIPLTIGTNSIETLRLISPGDFNIDIPYSALDGSPVDYTVLITATDTLGNSWTTTVLIDYESSNVWPTQYSIDWSSVTNIQDVAQVVDGYWAIQGDSVRTVKPGYDRLIGIGDISWRDYEVTVPVTVHNLGQDNGRDGTGVGILMRWTGHTDNPISGNYPKPGSQPKMGWIPYGVIGWFRKSNLRISDDFTTLASTSRSVQAGKTYIFKMRVETLPEGGSLYSLKVWEVERSEPVNWDLQGQTGTSDLQQGSLLLLAHEHDVSFGDVVINPLSGRK